MCGEPRAECGAARWGTPVLSRPEGSAPEVLRDGLDGFVHDSNEKLAAAVHALPSLSRARCRQYCAEHFDRQRMARDYERIYRRPLSCSELTNLALDNPQADAISLFEMSD